MKEVTLLQSAMNMQLAEALASLQGAKGARFQESWALFTPVKSYPASGTFLTVSALQKRVKALGYGSLWLRSVWKGKDGEAFDVNSLLVFRISERDALRLAGEGGQFFSVLKEGTGEAASLNVLREAGNAAQAAAEAALEAVYEVELPRSSYFRTKPVYIPLIPSEKMP